MKHVLSLFLTVLVVSFLATTANAQSGETASIAGTYEILKKDGTPVVPGSVVRMTIVYIGPLPSEMYFFSVTLDGDPVPGEQGVIVPGAGGVFNWINDRGNGGTIEGTPGGDLVSKVTTGPHAGTERLLDRQ